MRFAFGRLKDGLQAEEAVRGLWREEEDGELHGWVLLSEWRQESRCRVYQAQFESDPDLLVRLHLTDDEGEIPEGAQREFRR